MFKFLFGRLGTTGAKGETQRQTIERALGEINEITAAMAGKPSVTVDMASGALSLDLPEQMPDEALALPAPNPEAESGKVESVHTSDDADKKAA